jgi:hypothetical protein
MTWDSSSFDALRAEVEASVRGARPVGGVPFYVYLYDPTEEVRCLRQFEAAARALANAASRVQSIYLGQILERALRATLYLGAGGKRAEARDRTALLQELSRPNGLPSRITETLLAGIDGVCEPLRGGTQDSCAILLRAGALFPFVHVSQLLNALENQTGWTVVIPFPGGRHPERPETLRFLCETDGPYYRARIVGERRC